jgi:hypothetical protein
MTNDQLKIVLAAHVLVPLMALILDYFHRGKGVLDCMDRSGPDLCLIGLGGSGVLFIDPRIVLVFHPPVYLIIVLFLILIFRQICFLMHKDPLVKWRALCSCAIGLSSITVVSSILYFAYTR